MSEQTQSTALDLCMTIAGIMTTLASLLAEASSRAAEAVAYLDARKETAAIGSVAGLDAVLADAIALQRVIQILARRS